VIVLGQLGIGFIDDEVLEPIGSRTRRIMIAVVPKPQVNQDLADYGIVLDKGDHAHVALAFGAGQGIDLVDFLYQLSPAFVASKRSLGFGNGRYDFVTAGFVSLSAALVAVIPVIAHHLLAAVRNVGGKLGQPV